MTTAIQKLVNIANTPPPPAPRPSPRKTAGQIALEAREEQPQTTGQKLLAERGPGPKTCGQLIHEGRLAGNSNPHLAIAKSAASNPTKTTQGIAGAYEAIGSQSAS
ncbi:MAG: hypothetical protein ABSG59_17090 [Verrucomicrobiota bacterium]|jgi:hypothetical protein